MTKTLPDNGAPVKCVGYRKSVGRYKIYRGSWANSQAARTKSGFKLVVRSFYSINTE